MAEYGLVAVKLAPLSLQLIATCSHNGVLSVMEVEAIFVLLELMCKPLAYL